MDHIIINTTNRYNRKLRLAVFVFGWVHCRVFENLMGTQVKPLDCAWADKTLSQPITLFYSLSLSSWTQDTVCPCKNWLKLRPVDIGRQLVLASCQFGCRQLKISTTSRLSVHPPPNWSRAPWLSPAPMVADLNEKRRPLESRLRAGDEGYDGDVESVSEDLMQKD